MRALELQVWGFGSCGQWHLGWSWGPGAKRSGDMGGDLCQVYSSGRHSVRITGISDINFRAGFSMQPSLDLNHTIEWPLQGTLP